ncbi:MAG TPA: RT0821/Lpp0805 family surface protein [Gammaproteobacteria bacterium]
MPVIKSARIIALALTAAVAAPALADPPPHAPAHGWRKKHDPYYVGYSGVRYEKDFGIVSGRCNREEIATVVGGAVGGYLGSRIATENPVVGTVVGAVAGAVIGNRIGRELDERDRRCFGHALEIGEAGKPVVWTNESTGVRYELVPGASRTRDGAECREFTMAALDGRARSSRTGLACQAQPGVWEIES